MRHVGKQLFCSMELGKNKPDAPQGLSKGFTAKISSCKYPPVAFNMTEEEGGVTWDSKTKTWFSNL